mmetsp:Transcript_78192/g.221135  ORF Transcript_78192/g.221135 Transcript_78192/m.221135 type:complete len:119 (-) Transcript_78192:170-526(-)
MLGTPSPWSYRTTAPSKPGHGSSESLQGSEGKTRLHVAQDSEVAEVLSRMLLTTQRLKLQKSHHCNAAWLGAPPSLAASTFAGQEYLPSTRRNPFAAMCLLCMLPVVHKLRPQVPRGC